MEKTNEKKIRPRSQNAESNFIIDTICDTICGEIKEIKQGMKVLNSIDDTNLKMLNLLQQLFDGKKSIKI